LKAEAVMLIKKSKQV